MFKEVRNQRLHQKPGPCAGFFHFSSGVRVRTENYPLELKMERDQKLLVKILEVCIQDSEQWRIDVSAKDVRRRFAADQLGRWSLMVVNGHIELLVDMGCVNAEGEAPDTRIQRVTNAGYNYLERSKRLSLHSTALPPH